MGGDFRRVAAHIVKVNDTVLHQAIVEIVDGRVVNYYGFQREMPLAEWLGDTIEIRKNESGLLQAWWIREEENEILL